MDPAHETVGVASRPGTRLSALARAARTVSGPTAEAAAVMLFVVLGIVAVRAQGLGWDFRVFYDAGHAYLHGRTPYSAASLQAVSRKDVFVYPAPVAAFLAPMSVLPYPVAFALWEATSIAALAAALRLVGVADRRLYFAIFLSLPVLTGLRVGTVEPFLALLLAITWRYRDRRWVAAVAAAAVVCAKLFLWPLLLWLVFSRRLRTAVVAAGLMAAATVIAWLPIGLSNISAYLHLLGALSHYEETFSFSPVSLGLAAGLSVAVARVLACALGVGLLLCACRRRVDDFLSFRLALGAAFALSPIVWGHYWTLLLVPLALRRPRVTPVWFAAAWIPTDALFWEHRQALWIGAALAVAALQLGLIPPIPLGHRMFRLVPALVVMALATIAVSSGAEPALRGAYVTATTGPAFAVANLRIHPALMVICWIVWEEHAGRVETAEIGSRHGGRATILGGFAFSTDGVARGCATYPARSRPDLDQIVRHSSSYRLILHSARPLSGQLRGG